MNITTTKTNIILLLTLTLASTHGNSSSKGTDVVPVAFISDTVSKHFHGAPKGKMKKGASSSSSTTLRMALKASPPRRLEENVDGALHVNDRCINCAACSNFAPTIFSRSSRDNAHIVHKQPDVHDVLEIDEARAALLACPVSAIRLDRKKTSKNDDLVIEKMTQPPKQAIFPRPILSSLHRHDDVDKDHFYHIGHHNEASFGAVPFLAVGKRKQDGQSKDNKNNVFVMIDTPKYSPKAASTLTSITGPNGPDYLLLTHIDDVADHGRWKDRFPNMKRIFHSGDLGKFNWLGDESLSDVEVLLDGETKVDDNDDDALLMAWNLDGEPINVNDDDEDFIVIHTPGHSPGSISLLFRPSDVLFTGDTYAFTTRIEKGDEGNGGSMTGFPRYGNDLKRQAEVLRMMGDTISHKWNVVAPGHGHVRDYRTIEDETEREKAKLDDIEKTAKKLETYRKWR